MRKILLAACMVTVAAARADSTLPGPPDPDPGRCTHQDAPYWRDSQSELAKKHAPRGLYLKQAAGRRHLLYTSSWSNGPDRAVAVEPVSGKTAATLAGQRDAALVEDETGALAGLLAIEGAAPASRQLQLHAPSGGSRWASRLPVDSHADTATTLVAGDTIVIALFHRIATGGALLAVDLASGKLKWKADVEQMMVGHSKYWNDVALERRGDLVVMRGYEAAGCYLQTFDLATGKRRSSRMRKTW